MVLKEIQQDVSTILKPSNQVGQGNAEPNIDRNKEIQQLFNKEIQQLKDAQVDLFDKNSVSFQYQLMQIIMVVIGVGLIRYIQSTDKQRQEMAEDAKAVWIDLQNRTMKKSEAAIYNSTVLALQSVRLHTLSLFYPQLDESQQDVVRTMMRDFIRYISRHFREALNTGEGYEEEFYRQIALDSVDQFLKNVERRRTAAKKQFEKDGLKTIYTMGSRLFNDMKENADTVIKRYNTQWGVATRKADLKA